MPQVEARRRWRSKKLGLGIDAACLSVAGSAGGKSVPSTLILAASVARTTGGGCTEILVAVAERSRSTSAPTLTACAPPSRWASRVTSRGVMRSTLDR
jgi:hypothetical protein